MTNKLRTKRVISQALIYWRKKFDYTQKEVSAVLTINEAMYKAYEYASAEPSYSVLLQLRNLYGFKNVEDMIDSKAILSN